LKTGDLVKSENKTKEERDKGEKATAHLYWYVDYKNAIDCIKYRIHQISRKYDDEKSNHVQIQAYKCTLCNQRYTALQAAELAMTLWKCESCSGDVEEVSEEDNSNNVHYQQKAFHSQIASITRTLKMVEENPLPIYPRNTLPSFGDSQMYLNQGGSGHSYSGSSRSNSAAASFLGSTNGPMDIVVDLVGASSAPQANQKAQVEEKKVSIPWLSTSTDAVSKPIVEITTSTNTTESGVDEETYKLYIQQYYAELQRGTAASSAQAESDTSATEQPAVKQEPDEDSPTGKRRRVGTTPSVAEVVVEQAAEEQAVEEEQEASLEGWEDPIITVAGESMPFLSTLGNDELADRMTGEEYEIYADIVHRYAAFTGQEG